MIVAQSATPPIAVLGTVALFALFLSATAHLAARNVFGDVPVPRALLVGPVPAIVATVTAAFELPGALGLAVAIALDGAAIGYAYGRSAKLTAYATVVHFAVSVILGAMLYSVLTLFNTAPI